MLCKSLYHINKTIYIVIYKYSIKLNIEIIKYN